jgi:hypothetical protein
MCGGDVVHVHFDAGPAVLLPARPACTLAVATFLLAAVSIACCRRGWGLVLPLLLAFIFPGCFVDLACCVWIVWIVAWRRLDHGRAQSGKCRLWLWLVAASEARKSPAGCTVSARQAAGQLGCTLCRIRSFGFVAFGGGFSGGLCGGFSSGLCGGFDSGLCGGFDSGLCGGFDSGLCGGFDSGLCGGFGGGGFSSGLCGGFSSNLDGGFWSLC